MTYILDVGPNLRLVLIVGVVAYLVVQWWYLSAVRKGGPR